MMIKCFRSLEYNFDFNTKSGFFARWGKTLDDDPEYSRFGSEIFDIELSTICSRFCKKCFLPGTLVLTPYGYEAIDNIKINDIVYSYDEYHKKYVECFVEQLHQYEYSGDILEIVIGNNTLLVTPNHEFYTINRGWVKAENLTVGDDILNI